MISGELQADFKRTLFAGGYNLLLGAGTSLDSENRARVPLAGAGELRERLCSLKGVPLATSLSRVSALLTEEERRTFLTEAYLGCEPGPSLRPLPNYLWRRLFTFNIDDVLERLYGDGAKQSVVSLNYDAAFEPTPERDQLQIIHLHGWVGKPEVPYVFSKNEYARATRGLNPWMHLLSQILSTESFVIAGTTLDEPDLEYYLSSRSVETPRRTRGPSLLIDPSPNAATVADCERHGLILVRATFGEFLAWVQESFPDAPSVTELVVPTMASLFGSNLSPSSLLRFFSDFQPVKAIDKKASQQPSPFLYGREPTWSDVDEHIDIERANYLSIRKAVERAIEDHARPGF